MTIAAYCRVSTDKQDQLNSLETQKRFFSDYARVNGHDLAYIYADEGISGTKIKNRSQLQKLMNDAQIPLFDMIVVKDISRLARNAVDFLQCIRELKNRGIPCRFVSSDLSTEDGELILGMLALVAQEESANTSKRIKFSKRINAEKGRVPNLVYGYEKVSGDLFHLIINPEEAKVVRRIFDLYLHQSAGQNRIARVLNQEGFFTKRQCAWSQNAVARILSNPIYTGKIINGKQEIQDFLTGRRKNRAEEDWYITDRPDLKIIEPELFEEVQRLLRKRQDVFSKSHHRKNGKNLYSALIKCSCCGYSFKKQSRSDRDCSAKWICGGRSSNGVKSCPNRTSVAETALTKQIAQYVTSALSGESNAVQAVLHAVKTHSGPGSNASRPGTDFQERRDRLLKNRQKYIRMNLCDIISLEELKTSTDEIDRQLRQLYRQQHILRSRSLDAAQPDDFEKAKRLLQGEQWTNGMLNRLIRQILVDENGNINVYLNDFHDRRDTSVPV